MSTRKVAIALLALGAWLIPSAEATAAPAKPAWQMSATTLPTNFAPGSKGEYQMVATNVGGAPTNGMINFSDTLPEGVHPLGGSLGDSDPASLGGSCEISGQTVSCTAPGPINPGRRVEVAIEVEVADPPAAASVLNEASIGGGEAASASTSTQTTISDSPATFGFLPGLDGFSAPLSEADGAAATQAGSHPHQLTVNFGFPTELRGGPVPAGHPRDISTDLPPGEIINPSATPVLCTEAELFSLGDPGCPDASQIGIATVMTRPAIVSTPLYNMVPPTGAPASFGFEADGVGVFVHVIGYVRSDGDFGLSGAGNDLLALPGNPIFGGQLQLWGDPSSASHNQVRGHCQSVGGSCPVEPRDTALLTMAGRCTGQPSITKGHADSWEESGFFREASYASADLAGTPVSLSGCNQLQFEPSFEAKPTTNLAESPTGLEVDLHQPQDFDLEGLSTAALKDVTVTLPQGMTLNPAAADGIEGCSSEQIGLRTAIGESPIHLSKDPAGCPSASKLGTVEVTTPALARHDAENKLELDPETGEPIPEPLHGSIYLAKPFDNPFDSLLAVYLTVEDTQTGIVAKFAGEVSPDPVSGQLVTSFTEAPELPLEDVNVHLFGGSRAPFISPPLCGTHTTTATLTPWTSPEGADVHESDSFQTSALPGGGNCPTSPGQAPNSPSFSAGTIAPQAGAYSPFVLKLNREDGSQRLSGVDTTLAPGLIGKLAGVGKCSEAQIAAAKGREAPNQGAAEQASPSCPASSEVGTVDVSAGAGPAPLHVGAKAYLAGPYKGAPLSLLVITPAVAGPFDLGTVVLRVALYVNSQNAQIHAVSDPFPTVLEGIPLDIRGAALKMNRPNFTLNPTSCDPMAISGNASTQAGGLAALHSPFQVGGCSALGFKPKLALRLKGGTKRGGHPAFQATYTPRPGDANIKGLVVRLPRSAFLDQAHIRTICTRVQFAAKACPKGSQYGYIKAWTPLLEEPLQGPVYLRSSDHNLPDLVFDLHGVIDVEVATRIDSVHGGIRASIESAPDAPLSKVLLTMQGQKKGLIINSRNLCGGVNRADVELTGQNGKVADSKPELKASCGKRGHKRHGKGGHKVR
jgi:uncharacterized repeat protein (TIGR01451 family)